MPGGNCYGFFTTSSAPSGTLRNQKVAVEIRKTYFPRGKNKVFAAIFLVAVFSISYFPKLPEGSIIQQTKKIKRHLTMNEFYDYQEEVKMSKKDIEIVPENRRMNQYPNHKYTEKVSEEPMNIWFSKPFMTKKHQYPSNIQDVILKGNLSGQQLKGPNEIKIASGSSMRLKGIYKQSGSPESHLDENYGYPKEINNLMQNNSGNDVKGGGKRLMKNLIRARGAPFQLPGKDGEKASIRLTQKRRPMTIYLDFYPMDVAKFLGKTQKPKTESYAPFPRANGFGRLLAKESTNIGKFLPPLKKQNGIILKLNLYPKEFVSAERKFRKPTGGSHSRYNEKAERKSFGWFKKNKKKGRHPKECKFMGLNPHGKHRITAKWKNEKGEWIHADHVAVKYLKKENDSSKR